MNFRCRCKSLGVLIFIFATMVMTSSVAWGIILPPAITGFVWEDSNRNGLQDGGEPGIVGVTVKLFDSSGTLIGANVTDESGRYYYLTGTGNFQLQFVPPAGYALSPQDTGSDFIDSDPDPLTGYAYANLPVNFIVYLDAGMYKPPGGSQQQTKQVPAFTEWGLALLFMMIVLSERLLSRWRRRNNR